MEITALRPDGTAVEGFTQWDTGQQVRLDGVHLNSLVYLTFVSESYTIESVDPASINTEDDSILFDIPDHILQDAGTFDLQVQEVLPNGSSMTYRRVYPVEAANKPEGYVVGALQTKLYYRVVARVAALERTVQTKIPAIQADIQSINSTISTYQPQWDANTKARHTHANKAILDAIDTEDVTNFEANTAARHTHANKAILDEIDAEDVSNFQKNTDARHSHTNKTILDAIDAEDIAYWNAKPADSDLAANTAARHTHANKTVLDAITETDAENWDANTAARHIHANEAILDAINAEDVTNFEANTAARHTHANKTVLDAITETDAENWDANTQARHTHTNKTVLDGISSSQVEKWDGYSTTIAAIQTQAQFYHHLTGPQLPLMILALSDNFSSEMKDELATAALGIGYQGYVYHLGFQLHILCQWKSSTLPSVHLGAKGTFDDILADETTLNEIKSLPTVYNLIHLSASATQLYKSALNGET